VTQALGLRLAREDLATRDIFQILENDFAIALGHADLGIDATVADATLAQQLEVAVGAPLLYLERMTYTREGEPLELDYIHYRGDRFRYQLRIDRA
jgi:GntR family transcriptional regulator